MRNLLFFVLILSPILVVAQPMARLGTSNNFKQKELNIGDKLPNLSFKDIYNFKKADAELVADFGGKAMLIDFWFTYCGTCIENMPKMDSIHKKYADKLNILLSTYENIEKVKAFWRKKHILKSIKLPSVTSDSLLKGLFPYKTAPHIVWIDNNGIVKAITDDNAITDENIEKLLSGAELNLPVKNEIENREVFAGEIPLLQIDHSFNNGINTFEYSFIGGKISQTVSGIRETDFRDGKHRIKMANLSLKGLYEKAYSLHNLRRSQFIVNGIPENLLEFDSNTGRNIFSYDLLINEPIKEKRMKRVQFDLDRYFHVKSQRKRHLLDCYIVYSIGLDSIPKGSGEKSDGYKFDGNQVLVNVSWRHISEVIFKSSRIKSPLVITDESGIPMDTNVTITIPLDWNDLTSLNNRLRSQGLAVKVEKREVDALILNSDCQ